MIHIGDPIPHSEIAKFTDDAVLTEFVRQRSNEMASQPREVRTEELLQELDFVKGTRSLVSGRAPRASS